MPATTTYEFGDVVLVPFPFTDLVGGKWRPAAVISSAKYDEAPAVIVSSRPYNDQKMDVIVVIGITGSDLSPGIGTLIITDWKNVGLKKLSAIKPLIATVEKRKVRSKLGRLEQQERSDLKKLLGRILG
jgi:mRNA interferase MazF